MLINQAHIRNRTLTLAILKLEEKELLTPEIESTLQRLKVALSDCEDYEYYEEETNR